MSDLIVGISEMKISANEDDDLMTFALGSCVGIVVYDPIRRVGGLLHYMLPDSRLDQRKARENPEMFADTGIPMLLRSIYRLGGEKKRMLVKVAGGASILDDVNFFRIGQKNIMAMRKIFWENNILIDKEDTGLSHCRSVRLEMATGKVFIHGSGGEIKEL